MNLNKVFVLGNLTRDPERKVLPSGGTVVNFSIATNRVYYDQNKQKQEEVEFHNIVAFGKTAEIIAQYLKKGSLALIEGRLRTRNWQDQAGVKHYRTEIFAERLQLGPKPVGSSYSGQAYPSPNPSSNPNPSPANKPPSTIKEEIPVIEETESFNGFIEKDTGEIDVKDIPF
ncbi:single-stranded DNA-binding protein [bacterium (Candidatus Gribaldobacteria) CG08_land_8_20_14_0_20_39_15]|uniref:Single-stranded DNA-binding protein n=1 Tax=bacterium (Candidatus Gribaldobacteria) CG08_land_8_20_14_0_20_39_15 TaxID=2014273 RepID=A0A2M6XUB5_9BACT|nr:MAG: single-stranded DNA-binding protein [bacterium (Candidatus Gribaldobacteria) CG08_land_8_20_14_0_20_39_15]